jgi:hypothetical protein
LVLPRRWPRPEDESHRAFAEPTGAKPPATTCLRPPDHHWRVVHDLAENSYALEIGDGHGTFRIEANDLTITSDGTERYGFRDNDYASVYGETRWIKAMSRGAWHVRTVAWTHMTSDADSFHIEARLDAYENERPVYGQHWRGRVPRGLV